MDPERAQRGGKNVPWSANFPSVDAEHTELQVFTVQLPDTERWKPALPVDGEVMQPMWPDGPFRSGRHEGRPE